MRVVVVGTGVAGAGAGYALARAGAETVLVDAAAEGRATSAGAGIVCPWTSQNTDPAWYRMTSGGADAYPGLLDALAEDGVPDVGYRRVGALELVAEDEAERERARIAERASSSKVAGEVRLLTGAEARELFPPLGDVGPAVHVEGAARLDGRLLREALRAGAARHGARLETGHAELVLDTGGAGGPTGAAAHDGGPGGRVRGVRVDGELIEADAVIAATGPWGPQLLAPLGIRLPVVPQRGQIAHLVLPGTDTAGWPVVHPRNGHYLVTFDGGRVVAGATREDGTGFDLRVTAAGLAEVLGRALAVAPGLADATHVETRVGFRPMGPGGRPLLGPVAGTEGLVVANGLGPTGLTMGPYVGSLAARLALGEDLGFDLGPYDPLGA